MQADGGASRAGPRIPRRGAASMPSASTGLCQCDIAEMGRLLCHLVMAIRPRTGTIAQRLVLPMTSGQGAGTGSIPYLDMGGGEIARPWGRGRRTAGDCRFLPIIRGPGAYWRCHIAACALLAGM